MFCANESLNKNYILDYRQKYLGQALTLTTEELVKIHPMTDQQLNQIVNWNAIPCGNLNYFQSHRFFVVKGFLTGS